MGLSSRIGRLGIFIFFVGFAIHQLQNPQIAIKQTNEKTNQFLQLISQLTKSPSIQFSLDSIPLVVFSCALLKFLVGLGVLLKWNYVKLIGSIYLLSAIFVVHNPILSQSYKDSIMFVGALGALQFA
ncbi:unnamed protein product [Paramecium primaurelia]|uniref:Uncharacterized protein n=1 Tax=Paramecium primaurelia TaxID=5886 RepID=A0A8S1P7M9_PARPR|nr:unnamed protein product [Paramecium primaurelia]